MLDLRERVVLVTGAAGSLGSAVVAGLRSAGARTVLLERSPRRLEEAYGGAPADELLLLAADLADETAVRSAVDHATRRFGAVDALVATAGAFRAGEPVHREPLATWDLLLAANLRTTLVPCRAVLPGMLARGRGAIVTVASRDAQSARAGGAAYAAAVVRLTEAIAEEGRGRGVRASCVLPGALDTERNRSALPPSAWPDLLPVDAVADAILFLTSDASRALSGAALPLGAPSAR